MSARVSAAEPQRIDLPDDEIHLWLSNYEECPDSVLNAYRGLLSPEERAQEPRFWFAKDRRRYLVTRALLRLVLSRYTMVRPEQWSFDANAYGRPEIARSFEAARWLTFNLSHTHSLIALGISRSRAIGVDVENWVAREVSMNIADRYFAPDEVAALATVPREHQQFRFFEYWTFKESYIKARGMGLSLPLEQFGFRFLQEASVEIAIDPVLQDEPGRWHFWQLRPASEYLLAVGAQRLEARAPSLVVRTTVPMVSERLLECRISRMSGARSRS